jgi:hypothetical protein
VAFSSVPDNDSEEVLADEVVEIQDCIEVAGIKIGWLPLAHLRISLNFKYKKVIP